MIILFTAWEMPQFKIIALTDNRTHSLTKLYNSLNNAHYFGDYIDLTFVVEATAGEATLASLTTWVNRNSEESWQKGAANVLFRFRKAGLMTNIVEAWWPAGNDEYAFFFEDDVEASPFFFAWAKWAILMHRYGQDRNLEVSKNIYGISLIQQNILELDSAIGPVPWSAADRLKNASSCPTMPYLSQIPSSRGALYFPEHWREFRDYVQIRDSEGMLPLDRTVIEPSVLSDSWQASWKRFFIELVYLRGYTMMYPNYEDFVSLATRQTEEEVCCRTHDL